MSKNLNDRLLEDLEAIEKQALLQRYLQSPFSLTWSNLAVLSFPGKSLPLATPPISGGNRSCNKQDAGELHLTNLPQH